MRSSLLVVRGNAYCSSCQRRAVAAVTFQRDGSHSFSAWTELGADQQLTSLDKRCYSSRAMIRRLLLVFVVLAVATSSLGAVVPALIGDGECAGACCRMVHRKKPAAQITRLCCTADCNETEKDQHPSIGLLRPDGNRSLSADIAPAPAASFTQPSRLEQRSPGSLLRSTQVYLRTGSLLI